MAYKEKPEDVHAKNLNVLKDRIKQKNVGGSYVFYGEEEYTKNHYFSVLCGADEGVKLNIHTLCGDEFNLADYNDAISTSAVESVDLFGDISEEPESSARVVKLVNPDFSELSKKDMEFFEDTLSDLPQGCVVVFWFYEGQTDFLKKSTYKNICEKSLVVNFKKEPIGSAVLITWILRHFSRAKINIDRSTAVHLCSCVGNSMTSLKNEIDKCIEYLAFEKRDTLTIQDVNFICIKSTQAQSFDVSSGALSGNFVKSVTALKMLEEKKEKPAYVFGIISKAVKELCLVESLFKEGLSAQEIARKTQLAEFVVKNHIAVLNARTRDFSGKESLCKIASTLCFEYDTKIKSSRTDGFELLLELVHKLSFAGKDTN